MHRGLILPPKTLKMNRMFLPTKIAELSPADVELIKEAAGALARSGEKLEAALRQLREAEELLDLFPDSRTPSTLEEAIEQ